MFASSITKKGITERKTKKNKAAYIVSKQNYIDKINTMTLRVYVPFVQQQAALSTFSLTWSSIMIFNFTHLQI